MQKIQPNQAVRRGQIKHPTDLGTTPPSFNPDEIVPDCDPSFHLPQSSFQPPPRHPGRLIKQRMSSQGERPKSPPMQILPPQQPPPIPKRIGSKYAQARIQTVECQPETDDLAPMPTEPRSPSREQQPGASRRHHSARQQGGNSPSNQPRWSAFPTPPDGPPQPPPNRPLPQVPSGHAPPTPSDSLRSRKSSGASKRSTGPPQQHVNSPSPNMYPPSPPQEHSFGHASPTGNQYSFPVPDQHIRNPSLQSSGSQNSSHPSGSVNGFSPYTAGTVFPYPQSEAPKTPPQPGFRYMSTLQENCLAETESNLQRLASVSIRSSNSGRIQTSGSGRRTSSSTNSSDHTTTTKKGVFSKKGFKALVRGKTSLIIEMVKSGDLRGVLEITSPGHDTPDINATDRDRWTALHWAADMGNTDIAQVLLSKNAQTEARTKQSERTPLYLASAHGHAGTVRALLEHGAAVNAASKMDGATAIHKASQRGYTEVITALIAAKADVNQRDVEGMPPLMWATQAKQLHAAYKLVAAQADLEVRIKRGVNLENASAEGLTVLHKVAGSGDLAFARLFLEHGADPNANAPHGVRALHTAAGKGDAAMAQVLVEFGADVNLRSHDGWAPLHFAARHGHRKVCLLLVRQGAERHARIAKVGNQSQGETADELARKNGFEDLLA